MNSKSYIKRLLDKYKLELTKLKQWLLTLSSDIKYFCKKTNNAVKVLLTSCISLIILLNVKGFISLLQLDEDKLISSSGFWTLFTLVISSPIAFIIWYFRDKNSSHQIENARKDTNLKEFQKLAEWISGSHLIESKVIIKEKSSLSSSEKETEKTLEYTEPQNLLLTTHSKQEGAVGLQIAAIYNLLPFYRGERGVDFRLPAFNLLISSWLALQQKLIKELYSIGIESHYFQLNQDTNRDKIRFKEILNKLKENGHSNLGIAITYVLLSDGGDNLIKHINSTNELCLAGMDFNLIGLDKNKLKCLFLRKNNGEKLNLSGLKLQAANLDHFIFNKLELDNVNFWGASLREANFQECIMSMDSLVEADVTCANLVDTDFSQMIYGKLGTVEYPDNLWSGCCFCAFIVQSEHIEVTLGANQEFLKNNWIVSLIATKTTNNIRYKIYFEQNYGSLYSFENDIYGYEIDIDKTNEFNPHWTISLEKYD
ncbi:pentapeptide repeat-containing protein [Aggregatibacter aphrophilus]|uniref:pentapeptide repeat-containing protein n=1 Tax=Aggregatibacter kilianii TaxID=2025884 RepID=UPI000D650ACC|nr:pentapeptide repeat-containing protein [Aggregatibacter kilianii]RDE86570.1 pentapeptide repeat-containing protein [Aggregatibacter aphrophilus]